MKPAAIALAAALATAGVPALAADDSGGRFHIGLSWLSNMGDLRDKIEANNPLVDVQQVSQIGLGFSGYYLFNNGVAIGGAIGPAVIATGDASFYIVPVSLGARFQFVRTESVAMYAGAAVEQYFVGGDFIDSGSTGAALSIGLEQSKPRGLGWGLEAGYHSGSVKVKATPGQAEKEAHPGRVTASVFFLF